MKNSQKITRIHLPVSDHDLPVIVGLVSPDPDYKLSLKLNNRLNISLKNSDPVTIQYEEGKKYFFSKFLDSSVSPDLVFQLISNRAGKDFLLRKLINIDFLLLIHDPGKTLNLEQIISEVREIDSVSGVFTIDAKTLKDRNLKYLI
jgi:hypothetical protein